MSELKYGKFVNHKFDEEYKGDFVGKVDRDKSKFKMIIKRISDLIAYKIFGIDNRR